MIPAAVTQPGVLPGVVDEQPVPADTGHAARPESSNELFAQVARGVRNAAVHRHGGHKDLDPPNVAGVGTIKRARQGPSGFIPNERW